MILPWRWDIEGLGSISIGFAQAPRHFTSIFPACLFFIQATESPSRRPSSASLPKLPWAIENVGYGGRLEVLLVTYALVLYSASAVAETEGVKTPIGKIVKDSRDYTAQWQFLLDRMKALLEPRPSRGSRGAQRRVP